MDLDSWNRAFLDDIRSRGRPEQRIYLYVDRDVLGKLSGLEAAGAVRDFCQAFKDYAGANSFVRAADKALRWKVQGFPGMPSFVVYLAMTVLAVTEAPVGQNHGIYRRQNELLGLPAKAAAPPGYGESVPVLWDAWNSWLNGPGAVYGRVSARTHPHWTLQGWARSQAVIRSADRIWIANFLGDVRAAEGYEATVADFLRWVAYRGAAGRALLDRFEEDAPRAILQDVLEDESRHWPGAVGHEGGSRRRVGLLYYDRFADAFSGALEVDPAWYGTSLNLGFDEQHEPDERDPPLLVTPDVTFPVLLRDGTEHRLTEQVVVSFGGEDLYVMRDEPSLGGRLQCRVIDRPTQVRILAPRRLLAELRSALEVDCQGVEPRSSPVAEWYWLDDVHLKPDSPLLRVFRMSSSARGRGPQLVGGLRIGPQTYLVGGEPDVLLPTPDAVVCLDGVPWPGGAGKTCLSMADEGLDPGEHLVSSSLGTMTVQTVAFATESAHSGEVARPISRSGSEFAFGEPDRHVRSPAKISGAALQGVDVPAPLVVRRLAGRDCVILMGNGAVRQIWPDTPMWLRRIGLAPDAVDVLRSIRTTSSPVTHFVVIRPGHDDRPQVLSVPAELPRLPGHVESVPRSDLVAGFVATASWHWLGKPDPGLKTVLRDAILRRPERPARRSADTKAVRRRSDVLDRVLPDNPYDDVLWWLSEREHGRASYAQFAEAWSWLCERQSRRQLAAKWRLALKTLIGLGHIERDFVRRQVAVASAALVALPDAAGLYLLAGARPLRLMERINDPDDPDPVVAGAACSWMVHSRTPTDSSGQARGPSAIYLEWDSAHRDEVQAGLTRLGVGLFGAVADQLLAMQTSATRVLAQGLRLETSPSAVVRRQSRSGSGGWEWAPASSDMAKGLYCYELKWGEVFAWRSVPGGTLTEVSRDTGQWINRIEHGQRHLVIHELAGQRLLVPAELPLPALMDRALILRTGLSPYLLAAREGFTHHLAYENVDHVTARRVASLLEQDPQ